MQAGLVLREHGITLEYLAHIVKNVRVLYVGAMPKVTGDIEMHVLLLERLIVHSYIHLTLPFIH